MERRSILKQYKTKISFMLFILPALVLVCITSIVPFLMNISYSLTSWNGISAEKKFVGLKNFVMLFQDKDFFKGPVIFSLVFAVLYVLLVNIIALALGLLFVRPFRSSKLMRAMLYIPNIISLVMVGYVWKFLFGMGFDYLYKLTNCNLFNLSWLGESKLAFASILGVSLWQAVGFYCVIYIAGIQSVPGELLEAAAIDGANAGTRFRHVILPMIMPSVTVCLFTSLLNGLKVYDLPMVLTAGGPAGSTTSIAMDIYNEAFLNNLYGYGSAKSLFFFLIIIIVTFWQLRLTKRREVEA